MKSFLGLILVLILGTSCGHHPISEEGEEFGNVEVTQEVLEEKQYESDIVSFSRKQYSNLVELLYKEALVQDNELKAIDNQIIASLNSQMKVTQLYKDYQARIDNFQADAINYPSKIRDSLIQREGAVLLNQFNDEYLKTIATLKEVQLQNLVQDSKIHDYHKLLKLSTSIKMMEKYLKEEVPEIDAMKENLVKQKSLISQIQNHLKENK